MRDPVDRIPKDECAAQPTEQGNHRVDERIGSALRKPDAARLFKVMDQRVDAAGIHRIAAHQQGVEGQRLAQLVIAHEARNKAVDGSPRLMFHQGGGSADHAGKAQERDGPKLHIAFAVNAPRIFEKTRVASDIRRIEPCDFRVQRGFVV